MAINGHHIISMFSETTFHVIMNSAVKRLWCSVNNVPLKYKVLLRLVS